MSLQLYAGDQLLRQRFISGGRPLHTSPQCDVIGQRWVHSWYPCWEYKETGLGYLITLTVLKSGVLRTIPSLHPSKTAQIKPRLSYFSVLRKTQLFCYITKICVLTDTWWGGNYQELSGYWFWYQESPNIFDWIRSPTFLLRSCYIETLFFAHVRICQKSVPDLKHG